MTLTRCSYRRKRKLKKSVSLMIGIVIVLFIGYQTIKFSSSIFAMNTEKNRQREEIPKKQEEVFKTEELKTYIMNEQIVSDDYFKDALFIGDSRTQGFIIYTGIATTAYTSTGLMVDTALTKNIGEDQKGNAVSLEIALKEHSFKKIYIMLGINELGWVYENIFLERYQKLVQTIKRLQPDAIIYVQSILPVTEEKSSQSSIYKNDKIEKYNQLIESMAKEEKIVYLNVRESVENMQGDLPNEAATDGIHLTQKYCNRWLEYLKAHTVKEKNI